MTLHPEALALIRSSFNKSMWPKNEVPEEVWPDRLIDIGVFIMDMMVMIRSIQNITGNRISKSLGLQWERFDDKIDRLIRTIEENILMENEAENIDGLEEEVVKRLDETVDIEDLHQWDTRPMKCVEYARFVSILVKRIINSDNNGISPHTVILRFDRPAKTRGNKWVQEQRDATPLKVDKNVTDFKHLFSDDFDMPGNIENIFYSSKAKRFFYQYLYDYLVRRAFTEIPEGKIIIIDGLVSSDVTRACKEEGFPVMLKWDPFSKSMVSKIMHEEWYHFEAEADIGVGFWIFKLMNYYRQLKHGKRGPDDVLQISDFNIRRTDNEVFVVSSDDGDIIPTMLLLISKIATKKCEEQRKKLTDLRPGDILDGQVIFIRKAMKYAEEPYEGRELARRQAINEKRKLEKAAGNKNVRMMPLYKNLKQIYYISVEDLYLDIINSDISGVMGADDNLWYDSLRFCPYPAEVLSALCFIAGCDYAKSIPYFNFRAMFNMMLEKPEKYGKLILKEKISQIGDANSKFDFDLDPGANIPYKYIVDADILISMVQEAYKAKFTGEKGAIQETMNVFDFMDIGQVKISHLLSTHPLAGDDNVTIVGHVYKGPTYKSFRDGSMSFDGLYVRAACLAWCLAYFGNGSIPGWVVQDPFSIDGETGLPLYGFEKKNPAEDIKAGNVRYAKKVNRQRYYECF